MRKNTKVVIFFLLNWLSILQDMMNRDKQDELPAMQVNFIDAICLPVYKVKYKLQLLWYLLNDW